MVSFRIRIDKPVFRKILSTYCIIFLLPIIVFSVVNYNQMNKIFMEQDKEFYTYNLKIAKHSVEGCLKNIRNTLNQVENQKWVREFAYSDEKFDDIYNENSYMLHTAVKDLKNAKNNINEIEVVGVFFKKPGFVIDNYYINNTIDYYKNTYKVEGITPGRWLSLTDSYYNFEILSSDTVLYTNKVLNGFTFMKTLHMNDSNSSGLIFTFVKREAFTKALSSFQSDDLTCGVIIDDDNRIIAQTQNFDSKTPIPTFSEFQEFDEQYTDKNNNCVYYSTNISSTPWKLVFIVPFMQAGPAPHFPSYLVPLLITIFAAGIIISYLLSLYNYKPLLKLVQALPGSNINTPLKDQKNKYKAVENKIESMKKQKKSLDGLLESYRNILKDNLLYFVLRNDCERQVSEKVLDSLIKQCAEGAKQFSLVLIRAKGTNNSIKANAYDDLVSYIENFSIVIGKAVDPYGNAVLLISNTSQPLSTFKDNLLKYSQQLGKRHHAHIALTSAATSLSIDDIRKCYNKALDNLLCISYEEVKTADQLPLIPLDMEVKWVKSLKAGEFNQIQILYDEIMKTNETGICTLTSSEKSIVFYEMVSIILKFFEEQRSNGINFETINLDNIYGPEDILNISRQICKERNQINERTRSKTTTGDMKNSVIKYINDNYLDPGMCLKLVKSKFNISFALITRIVKEYTGYSFLEYLGRRRIEHAKKLLEKNEFTISEVGKSSGFNDDSTFIKTFKKYEKTTPGSFQQEFHQNRR